MTPHDFSIELATRDISPPLETQPDVRENGERDRVVEAACHDLVSGRSCGIMNTTAPEEN
jgi:hypothetical protein